jgi:hypothetical protein
LDIAVESRTTKAFITPIMATKIIDFVHLLNNKTPVTSEVRS